MIIFNDSKYGPVSKYSGVHVYLVLDTLVRKGTLSRGALSEELGIGEGSTRNLLKIMRGWRMVSVSRAGVSATPEG